MLQVDAATLAEAPFLSVLPNTLQVSAGTSEAESLAWAASDTRRMLHVVYNTGDIDKTVAFFKALGMSVTRSRSLPQLKQAFTAFGSERSQCALEITEVPKQPKLGNGFLGYSFAAQDVNNVAEQLKAAGACVRVCVCVCVCLNKQVDNRLDQLGGMQAHSGYTLTCVMAAGFAVQLPSAEGPNVAYTQTPNGDRVRVFQQQGPIKERFSLVSLRVSNLERSVAFYRDVLGMRLLRTKGLRTAGTQSVIMGYAPELEQTAFELVYMPSGQALDRGEAYVQMAVGTDNV